MKKLLLIALLALTFSAGAQVTYIGEVEGSLSGVPYSTQPADRYIIMPYCYYAAQDGWDIYNPDLTLYKSFHGLPFSPGDSGVECLVLGFLGKHAVNNDDKYEFIVEKRESTLTDTTHVITSHLYIYNEDGAVLYTFPDVFTDTYNRIEIDHFGESLGSTVTHLMDGKLRVAILYSCYGGSAFEYTDRTKLYEFDGSPDMEDIVEVPEAGVRSMPAFPNPTRGEVTLPYTLPQGERATMQIFDMSGRLIEQRPISGEGRMVKIDVSAYAPGVYLYEYKGQTNRFVVR